MPNRRSDPRDGAHAQVARRSRRVTLVCLLLALIAGLLLLLLSERQRARTPTDVPEVAELAVGALVEPHELDVGNGLRDQLGSGALSGGSVPAAGAGGLDQDPATHTGTVAELEVGIVHGHVRDRDGGPLAGARLWIVDREADAKPAPALFEVRTDEAGYYRFEISNPGRLGWHDTERRLGRYNLQVHKEGYVQHFAALGDPPDQGYSNLWLNNLAWFDGLVATVDWQLARQAVIDVQLVDEAGVPVAGSIHYFFTQFGATSVPADLVCESSPTTTSRLQEVERRWRAAATDEAGRASIGVTSQVALTVYARAPSMLSARARFPSLVPGSRHRLTLVLIGGRDIEVTLVYRGRPIELEHVWVDARAIDAPTDGPTGESDHPGVHLRGSTTSYCYGPASDRGTVIVPSCPLGPLRLDANAGVDPEVAGAPADRSFGSTRVTTIAGRATIGATETQVTIELVGPSVLRVRLIDRATGQPAPKLQVAAVDEAGDTLFGRRGKDADEEGFVTFAETARGFVQGAGATRIVAVKARPCGPGYRLWEEWVELGEVALTPDRPVTIEGDVTPSPTGIFVVHVSDTDGNPIEGAGCTLRDPLPPAHEGYYSNNLDARSDAQGVLRQALAPGSYIAAIWARGAHQASVSFEVAEGATTEQQVVLGTGATVAVRTLLPFEPNQARSWLLLDPDHIPRDVQEAVQVGGTWVTRFRRVPPGMWRLYPRALGAAFDGPYAPEISVENGDDIVIDVDLPIRKIVWETRADDLGAITIDARLIARAAGYEPPVRREPRGRSRISWRAGATGLYHDEAILPGEYVLTLTARDQTVEYTARLLVPDGQGPFVVPPFDWRRGE